MLKQKKFELIYISWLKPTAMNNYKMD